MAFHKQPRSPEEIFLRTSENEEPIKTKQKPLISQGFLSTDYLTASLSALPGLNAGTLLAEIWISSPV